MHISTWVLVVVVFIGPASTTGGTIGVTSIPGYNDKEDCETAAKIAQLELSGVGVKAGCIPGPTERKP